MLHKSFKSAKCKTALKLASSRIKLMKNKKGVQMNQMKRDLAQLLETGQDRTARIRVEHVIREEKMVAAYELIEIYCELIVARLPIIESQKTCPIDLKEAVTSVIFAAPRCSDISELSDIKKQFTAKYGKEFVTAAIELRPDCGVSRMLVEKLSAVAPNVQTKVKVLTDVAKEHNIEWDPTSFEEKESKPPNDLLNGPSNIEKASIPITNLPKTRPLSSNDDHSHEEKQNAPFDFAEQNRRYTLGTQNVNSTDDGVGTSSFATHHDSSSSGTNYEKMKSQQPDFRGDYDYSSGRESWNMEFKDATSAAQAAAESAERAAMAARAAAQFSNQEKIAKQRQNSSPQVSNIKDETPRVSKDSYESSSGDRKHKIKNQHIHQSQHENSQKAYSQFSSHEKIVKEHPSGSYVYNIRDETPYVSKNSHESFSSDKNKKPNQHIDLNRHDISQKAAEGYHGASHGDNIRSGGPTSFRSDNETIDDEKLVNDFHIDDEYFEESMHEEQTASSSPAIADLGSGQKESFKNENIYIFAEEATKNKPSIHSSTSSDEADIGKRNVVGNPFKEATNANSNVVSQRDDEPISDDEDDGPRFDSGGFDYDEVEATQSLENTHIWSPKRNISDKPVSQSHLFSESLSFGEHSMKSVEPSEADDHVASFDHSDGPDSESESELIPMKPEPSYVESSHDFDSQKSRIELNDLVEVEPSFDNPEHEEKKPQSQHELKKHNLDHESYDTLEDNSNYQPNDLGLNFGTLTGGFRNKGGIPYPPYTKSVTKDSMSMSKNSIEESSATGGQTFLKSSLDLKMSKPNVSISSSDSDLDSDSDVKSSKHANTRSQFSPPAAFVNDDESLPGLKVSKQLPSRAHLSSGLSRRTRGSPSVSYSKTRIEPEGKTVIPTFSENSREYSYPNKVPAEPQVSESQPFTSSRTEIGGTKTQQTPGKQRFDYSNETMTAEKKPEPKIPSYKPVSSRITVDSGKTKTMKADKLPGEDAVKKQSHVHVSSRIAVGSGDTKSTKADKLPGEDAVKKPSHVHPKLPDYDSLAARLQSLRNNDH